jgi:RHS repeat-associated protein
LLAQRDRTVDGVQNALLAADGANSVLAAGSDPSTSVAYSPYGHRENPALMPGLPGFNGEQPDPLTGHYLLGNGYRAFNPVLMRFNSPDSLSPFDGGGLNPYAYCLGDPINRVDPTGRWAWPLGLGLMAGSAVAVSLHFATRKTSPEASSILGWVGMGLGIVSAGMVGISAFQKIGNRLHQSFIASGGLSGRNGGGLNIAAGTGPRQPPNPTLGGMPLELLDRITRGLSPDDMARLSRTSTRMHAAEVKISASRTEKLVAGASTYQQVVEIAAQVGTGQRVGISPGQANRMGFTWPVVKKDYPHSSMRLPSGRMIRFR